MTSATTLRRLGATALLALAGTAHAALVEGADVGGFRTFVDTSTGTVWADLDNHLALTSTGFGFRFTDFADYQGALTAAGFSWATVGEVAALMAATPLATTTEYDALGAVMGSVSFGETTTLSGYANASDGLVRRQYGAPDYPAGTASWATAGFSVLPSALNDSGLWAFIAGAPGPGGSVPLPGTLALAGLGLAAAASQAGRSRATA
jgi:PEP-CTERM motif